MAAGKEVLAASRINCVHRRTSGLAEARCVIFFRSYHRTPLGLPAQLELISLSSESAQLRQPVA
jgi:hypothetical protein